MYVCVLQGATPVGTREGILFFFLSLYLTPYFLLFARNKKERSPIQCFRINEGSTGGLECTKLQNERAYCFSLCSPLFDAFFLSPFLYLTLSRYYHRLPPPLSSFHSFSSSLFFYLFFSLSLSLFFLFFTCTDTTPILDDLVANRENNGVSSLFEKLLVDFSFSFFFLFFSVRNIGRK